MPPQAPRGQPWPGEQPAPWTRTLSGHERGVCSVAVMADGRHALSGSEDETIRLWDLEAVPKCIGSTLVRTWSCR